MTMLKKHSMVLWMNHMIEDSIFWAIAALLAIYIAILLILALM